MSANLMSKSRKTDNPYLIYRSDDRWEWRVLKSYQTDNLRPYARWFCAVKSPYHSTRSVGDGVTELRSVTALTYDEWEMGDTYVADVLTYGRLVYRDPIMEGQNLDLPATYDAELIRVRGDM